MTNDDSALMIDYLTEEGLSWVEIEHVLTKLKEHDQRVFRESVFDSIDSGTCLLYTSPSPRDQRGSRMPSSA